MADRVAAAIDALSELRRAATQRSLAPADRRALEGQIDKIVRTLHGQPAPGARLGGVSPGLTDAYAQLLGTPDDLQRDLGRPTFDSSGVPVPSGGAGSQASSAAA